GQLAGVLARVRVGRAEDGQQPFVDHLARGVNKAAVVNGITAELRRVAATRRLKERSRNGPRLRAGDADDGDPSLSWGRCDGGDRNGSEHRDKIEDRRNLSRIYYAVQRRFVRGLSNMG